MSCQIKWRQPQLGWRGRGETRGMEDKIMEKEEADKKRDKKIQVYVGKIRELSDALKRNNLRIIGIPEEEERGKGGEGVLEEIIAENSQIWGRKKALKSKRHREFPSDVT